MSDLISREKLKDDIAVLLERNDKLIDEWLANCIDDVIDEQPTVDAEKHGHWEDVKVSDDGKLQSAKCSVCGRYETKPYMYYLRLSNYCSWCGAKNVSDTDVGKKEEEE